jgi:glucokinase
MVFGLVGEDGLPFWRRKVPTEVPKGPEHMLRTIAANIDDALAETGTAREAVMAVGVGMPGKVDADRGICMGASNLRLRDYPVAAKIREATGLPCYINNDVKMYIYGEALYGAAKDSRHVLGVTIGTGLAGALIIDGEPYGGYRNISGEIGHIPIDGVKRVCNCGMVGCLETVVSAPGLARSAREAVLAGERTLLADYHDDPAELTAVDVSRAFDAGDQTAIAIMRHAGRCLGDVLAYLIPMLSPDAVIIGGGVALAGERLLGTVREVLHAKVSKSYIESLKLETAVHNDDAGVIGSAAWAVKKSKE